MVMVQNLKTMKDVSSSLEDLGTSSKDCEKIVAWLAPELGYPSVKEKTIEKKTIDKKTTEKMTTALLAPRHDNRKKRRTSSNLPVQNKRTKRQDPYVFFSLVVSFLFRPFSFFAGRRW